MKSILALILMLNITTLFAQSEMAKRLPMDPSIKMGILSNGLKYFIQKNTEPKNRAQLRLVVKAGSVLETDAQQGLAHFMEHMNFNGTKNFPKNELVSFLQKNGVKFGADLNAYTSFDETVYMLPVPTDSTEVLKKGMQILEDWAHNATLDDSEIDKERGVVLEESRLGKGAQQRMSNKYLPMVLSNSQYAKRLPIGKDSILQNFKYNTLKQFYKDWYRPNLQAVMVVGDVDVVMIEKMIKEKFGKIPKATKPKPRTDYKIGLNGKTEVAIVTDKEQPYTIVQVLNKQSKRKDITYQNRYDGLMRNLYNQMLSARIQELTQKADPPFLFGYAGYNGFLGNLDSFTSFAVAKGGEVETALKAVLEEVERAKKFGFTQSELDRTKKTYLDGQEKMYKEKDKTSSEQLVGGLVGAFTQNEPLTSIEFSYNFAKKYTDGIKLTEVNALSNIIITDQNRAVIIMGPEKDKDKLPSESKIIEVLGTKFSNLKAYEDKTVEKPLVEKIPEGTKVINKKEIPEIGVTELTFGNGVKAVIKTTDFKNDEIQIGATSPGGSNLYENADADDARFATPVTSLSGVGEFSNINLQKLLAGKTVQISPYISDTDEGFYGSSSPKDFETGLQLIYNFFTKPRFDGEVIKGFISNQRDALVNQLKTLTPEKVFQDSLIAIMTNYAERSKPITPERMDKINANHAFDIYKERFADASDFTFFFVGNIKVAEATPILEKYLGGLPTLHRKETFKDLGIRPIAGKVEKTVYKGTEPKAKVSMVWTGNYTSSPENDAQIEALSEVLEIKLTETLREEESGVYGVGVSGTGSKIPAQRYSYRISFGCAPVNVEKLVNRTLLEIQKIKEMGAEQVDIDKYKAETKRAHEVELRENSFWTSYLQGQVENGEDLKEVLMDSELLKKVDITSSKQAAITYFGDNFIKLILLPEKK